MSVAYLFDPVKQFISRNGVPLAGGFLNVFVGESQEPADTYSDPEGTVMNPRNIPIDSAGRALGVFVDDSKLYTLKAYNSGGMLQFTIYPMFPGNGGGGTGGTITEMQHWLGMYGPTYTPFPGDNAGHTLGISNWEVDYVGDFIDHISTCPYPDGTTPRGYIYLKPGLYYVSCIIRYQQASDALSNTLDEILIYTGAGNANESLAYQMDSSGPEATGNRHNIRVQFIRRVPDNVSSGILYFAPGTPIDWKEAYIQRLEIVKLNSVAVSPTIVQGLEKVHHDGTLVGDGTVANPLGVDSDSVQKKLIPGDGLVIDSDGTIHIDDSVYQEKLTAGEHIEIDSDNVVKTVGLQEQLTAGEGIEIDSDGVIRCTSTGQTYIAGENITIDSDNVISATGLQKELTADYGIELDSDGNIGVDPNIIPEVPPILPLVAGENVTIEDSDGVVVISADAGKSYSAGEHIAIDSDGVISTTGLQEELTAGEGIILDSDGNISVDSDAIPSEPVDFAPLVAGENITIEDSDGSLVISATGDGQSYTAGYGIDIDSDGVISYDGEESPWELDSDGYVTTKGGKDFKLFGSISYVDVWSYHYARMNQFRSNNGGFEVDHMIAEHTDDNPWGNFNKTSSVYTDMLSDPYNGAAKGGLVVNSGKTGTGNNPASRVDIYAGSNSGYKINQYQNQTYVQVLVAGTYIRLRSDDIVRHYGSTESHAVFVLTHPADTTKQYTLQPTAIAGNYTLVEVSAGSSYTAGEGIDIDSDGVISVKVGFINM